ncbi:MAG TPA: PEPxxWA-CTERM sorting domain-containing protein [Usitatibacter sp.]|nr:PEPxxWA-CTERM sorting domain-containing protein [Usitatibacter sp.]
MKFQLQTLVVGIALAAAATTVDAQVANQNGAARGPNTSFYFGRNIPNAARSDPVNSPGISANPMSRPTARFGVVGQTPVTPVPEPSEWAMMLAGLALVGFIVRRNSKRS